MEELAHGGMRLPHGGMRSVQRRRRLQRHGSTPGGEALLRAYQQEAPSV